MEEMFFINERSGLINENNVVRILRIIIRGALIFNRIKKSKKQIWSLGIFSHDNMYFTCT